jgi:biotin carboxylase
MRLLAVEARQNATYYLSRYQQVEEFGAELFVLNGVGEPDFWPAARYRVAGSQKIDDIIAAATQWHAEHQFDGVLTFSESGVMTVAAVAEALGLPGVGVNAARNSRNKLLMRQAHQRAGVPHPRFRFVASLDEALAAAAEFGYPAILKPTLGAASNFVFRVDTPQDMRARYADAVAGIARMSWFLMEADGMDLGPHGLLVESFLDGHEHLIEALAWDDEVYLGSVVDRVTVEGGTFDDDVHHAPTSLSEQDLAAVHRVVTGAAHAQGLRRCAMHAEVRFHEGRPHILEIAIRPGGGGLDLVARTSADYCPIRAVMDVARGVKPRVRHYQPTGLHITGMCLICDAGVIDTVTVPPEVANSDRVPMLKITARRGDVIRRPPEGNSILGFLYTTGNSMDDAMRTMTAYAGEVQVTYAADGQADRPASAASDPAGAASDPASAASDPAGAALDRAGR